MPDLSKPYTITTAGSYRIKTDCWYIGTCGRDTYKIRHLKVNGAIIGVGVNEKSWAYSSFPSFQLKKDDIFEIEAIGDISGGEEYSMYPCNYLIEEGVEYTQEKLKEMLFQSTP